MITFKTCAICGKSPMDATFLKRALDEPNAGDPVYWGNRLFNPELTENIIFCCPEHSLEWYQQKKLKPTA